jgi:NTE family protein
MKKRKKLGLALGSGGARGLYHIGVLKALAKHNIPIDYIAGSSVGAWVGAYYALYQDIERLEELTGGMKTEKLASMIEFSLSGGLIKGEKLERLLDGWLKGARFSNAKIPFRAVATDLLTGTPFVFETGKIAPALRASMAIPGAFKPVAYKDKILIDGGVSNPVPDDIVRQMGADVVLAVNLNGVPRGEDIKNIRIQTISETLETAIRVLCYHLAIATTRDADIILRPYLEKYASWTDYFLTNRGYGAIVLGEQDTNKIIPALRRKLKG